MNPLTHFPRHPSAPDTYYINGAWAPAAVTAVEKRFTDAELAAEYWASALAIGHVNDYLRESGMCQTFRRFARLPHHDEDPL
jgi:hypothetical protein